MEEQAPRICAYLGRRPGTQGRRRLSREAARAAETRLSPMPCTFSSSAYSPSNSLSAVNRANEGNHTRSRQKTAFRSAGKERAQSASYADEARQTGRTRRRTMASNTGVGKIGSLTVRPNDNLNAAVLLITKGFVGIRPLFKTDAMRNQEGRIDFSVDDQLH